MGVFLALARICTRLLIAFLMEGLMTDVSMGSLYDSQVMYTLPPWEPEQIQTQ